MTLNWDAVLVGTIPAVVNAVAILFATRYAGHLLTRLEKRHSNDKNMKDIDDK